MVVCMEKEILPFVPIVLENLLKQPDARELHDFLPLMNQMIMKFKVSILGSLSKMKKFCELIVKKLCFTETKLY